jgi:hypothetical protein
MLKKTAVGLVVLLVVAVAFIATRPSDFQIVRTRVVSAPPEVVHAQVNDLRKWAAWSPWEKLDPAMTREISGAPSGPGATYHWSGNKDVGEGRMTITDSQTPSSVTIRLEFIKPWTATNTTRFDLTPSGAGTNVTWTMSGRNNFMAKAFGLFVDIDKMVGADFEKGLASLDAVTAATVNTGAAGSPVS